MSSSELVDPPAVMQVPAVFGILNPPILTTSVALGAGAAVEIAVIVVDVVPTAM